MIPNHKGEIPAVLLLLPFLLGIGLGLNLLAGANATWLIATFAALNLAFILLNLYYNQFRLYKSRWLGGVLIAVILFLSGLIRINGYSELNNSDHFSKIPGQYLVVKITNEPTFKNGLLRFTTNVEESINNGKKTATSGTLLITLKDGSAQNLYYGDELLIPAKYNAIDPPFNPAEFNYKQYLANKNIYYQAFLYQKQFAVLRTNAGNPLIAGSLRLRRQLVEKLKRNISDTGAFAVASTLILGYRADLSPDILQSYSKTGTVYVLTVSGAQVAIIYLLLTFALKFLNRYKYGRFIKAAIIIAVIWYYAFVTGLSLAVCRVALMVSMVIIGRSFSRYVNTLNILAISAFLLVLYDPFFITEVGFQLSYLAVSGLIVLQPIVYKWFKFKSIWADKLWAICSVSITAQVIISPISAFYFHQFPVYFLISNLFVFIPSALIMYTGVFYLLLPQIPYLSKSIAFMLEKTTLLMNKGLAVIENMPYASINKLWLKPIEYLLLYIIIFSLFYFFYDKKVWLLKLSMFCTLLLCLGLSKKKIESSQSNSIVWLDLKKHKGIVFKNGNEAIVLTDLKSTDKIFQYSIQPYLDSCQVNKVQVYSLTQDINASWLIKKNDLVQFLNKRIFIFDGRQRNSMPSQKIKTDYIYVTDNPYAGLNVLNSSFDYRTLVADGSNSDNLLSQVKQQAEIKDAIYKVLKRNNSLLSVSN